MLTAMHVSEGHYPTRLPRQPELPPCALTPREREALELAARGFSCAEIARLQQVSVHTTRSHLKSVYAKLDVHSKSEAVFEATAIGLLRPETWTVAYHGRRDNLHDGAANHPEPGARLAGVFAGA